MDSNHQSRKAPVLQTGDDLQLISTGIKRFNLLRRLIFRQWATTKAKSAGIQDKTCRNYFICLSPNEYIDCNQYLVWPLDRFEHIVSRLHAERPSPARRQSIRFLVSRDRRIRTFDHSAPNGALYQTELHPDKWEFFVRPTTHKIIMGQAGIEPTTPTLKV